MLLYSSGCVPGSFLTQLDLVNPVYHGNQTGEFLILLDPGRP